jgi:predicted DNA-binding transcriptional regulator AlpA
VSEPLLLNLFQAAELLGLKPQNLYELTRSRSRVRQAHPIPFCRLGKRIAFRRESLEQWITRLEAEKAVTR